ncbi:MAG: DUF2254 domain-containing protein [Pseudomonadota bacterium]
MLTILASSMLAVSTFSLNIMVTAHRAAADTATPRLHRILLDDTTTQSVLSVFIGAFVYSLASIVLFQLGFFPDDAAIFVMAITCLVVVAVILSLLRWINHLTTLGSLEDSLRQAKSRAQETLRAQARNPRFGGSPLSEDTVVPLSTRSLRAPETGYLQLIDMAKLEDCLPDRASLYLNVSPGTHVLVGETLGEVSGVEDDEVLDKLAKAFTFGSTRTHEQDAALGLITLSEIASKALSPGINDPGTAVEVLMIMKSLLWDFVLDDPDDEAAPVKGVFARFPNASDLLVTSFGPIARDSAGNYEVTMHLMESLAALSALEDQELSTATSALAKEIVATAAEADLSDRELSKLRSVTFTNVAEK